MAGYLITSIAKAGVVGSITAALVGLIVPLISIALAVLVGIYIYRDAKKRGLNANLWLIIIMINWLAGLIIYYIIRDDDTAVTCSNCGNLVKGNIAFCPKCGTPVQREEKPSQEAN